MTDPVPVRRPGTPLEDVRFVPFENRQNCDLNAMNDAVNLVLADPTSVRALNSIVRNTPGRPSIDFNGDGNPNGQASSHEWASALIAAAQIAYERGIRMEDVSPEDIHTRGSAIYCEFQEKLTGVKPATCNVPGR